MSTHIHVSVCPTALHCSLTRFFHQLWEGDGLPNLCLIPYGCMATSPKTGIIEVVKNARTIAEVTVGVVLLGVTVGVVLLGVTVDVVLLGVTVDVVLLGVTVGVVQCCSG